ncbi:MAG: hypothetical protein LUF32_06550 [Clostridiales bacterium]|nr:hypothetical protein [Clostridiales bacterium]
MNYLKKVNKCSLIIWLLLIVLVVFRIWLSYNTPVYARTELVHDDGGLMNMTINLMRGNWLGEYSQFTLMKGCTYSLFCAFCGLTRIPYSVFLSVLYIVSAGILVKVLKNIITKKWVRYVVFLFLIYSPITFHYSVVQRLYRNALTVPFVLLIFAGILGIYFNLGRQKNMIKYSVLAGVSLFFFCNLREDTIWIFPFAVIGSIFSGIFLILHGGRQKKLTGLVKKMVIIFMPFFILCAGNLTLRCINYSQYGIFATNDRTKTAFNDVAELFIKIDYDDTDPELNEDICFMSIDKYEYIIDHSESLSEYKDIYLAAYRSWASTGKYVYGDIIQWSFRTGLANAGFYLDGKETIEYLQNVRDELQEQINNGELMIKSGIFLSSSTKMLEIEEIPYFVKVTITDTARQIFSYEGVESQTAYSSGSDEEIREWEFVVNSMLLYPDEEDDLYVQMSDRIVELENHIIKVYEILRWPLCILSVLSFVAMTILQVPNIKLKNKRLFNRWIILLAVLLSAFVQMFIFTVFSNWGSLSVPYYCSGAYILMEIFKIVSIYCGLTLLYRGVFVKIQNKGYHDRDADEFQR